MSRAMYYDREGRPISIRQLGEFLQRDDYRRVASTEIGQVWVSTVWLGVDHGFGEVGPPLIFETMIFSDGDMSGEDQWRWATVEAALAGHDRAVEWVRFRIAHALDPAPEGQW